MGSILEAIDKLTIAIHKTTSLQGGKLSTMLQPQRGLHSHRGWCLDAHPKRQLITIYVRINTCMIGIKLGYVCIFTQMAPLGKSHVIPCPHYVLLFA